MMRPGYTPKGTRFIDKNLGEMLLVQDPSSGWDGWLCKKHPDGQWVSFRKATEQDIAKIKSMSITVDIPMPGDAI